MVNKLSLLLLTLVLSMYAAAQTATVTATIQDPAGQVFANGTVNVQFLQAPNSNGPYTVNGAAIQLNGSNYTGPTNFNLDGTGSFSITMSRNDFIQPAKSQWQFIVCSNADSPCTSLTTTISSASVSLTSLINSLVPTIAVSSIRIPRAYQDSEIINTPNWGQFYYNIVDGTFHVFNNGLWTNVPTNGSSPTFNVLTTTTINNSGTVSSGIFNATTGFQVSGAAISGRYLKGNGTNFVVSTGAASGVGTPTACTNQFITSFTLNGDSAPISTCTTATLTSGQFANQGTTTTVLHGNAAGNPSFSGISLTTDTNANQGTTSQVLHGNAAGQPAFSSVSSTDLASTTGSGTSVELSSGGTTSVLNFICNGTATASSTLFLGHDTCTSGNGLSYPITSAATIKNLFCHSTAVGVNAASGLVTVRKNTSNQTLTCTFGTTQNCSDTSHSFSVISADFVDIIFTTQAAETLSSVVCAIEKQ